MKIDRFKNAKRNMVWGAINKLIVIVFPFIIRTILLQKLGGEYLGLNSLFSSILQVLSLAELGIGSAITFSMYKPIAEDDTDSVCALLAYYQRIYRLIGCAVIIIGIVILPFLGYMVKDDCPSDVNLYILYIIYLINTSISYFMFAYKQCLLLAHQRNDIDSNIISLINIALYICQIVSLLVFPNYYVYIIFIPISTIVMNIVRKIAVDRMFPEYVCRGSINADLKKELYKRISGLMLYKISYVFRNSFDSIIISSFLGLVVLANYQNYYYILNSVMGILAVVTASITAGVGNSLVTESKEKNYNDFKKFNFIFNWIVGWCVAFFLCLYQDFITLWIGKEYLLSFSVVVLMCIYFYSLEIGNVTAVYREASGIWWQDKFRPIIESIVNLVINVALVSIWGVSGVIISTIICIVFINIPWATCILFKNYFKRSPKEIFLIFLKNALIISFTSCVTFLVCKYTTFFISSLWKSFLVKTIICCIIPNILMFICYYKNQEFDSMIKIVRKMIQE